MYANEAKIRSFYGEEIMIHVNRVQRRIKNEVKDGIFYMFYKLAASSECVLALKSELEKLGYYCDYTTEKVEYRDLDDYSKSRVENLGGVMLKEKIDPSTKVDAVVLFICWASSIWPDSEPPANYKKPNLLGRLLGKEEKRIFTSDLFMDLPDAVFSYEHTDRKFVSDLCQSYIMRQIIAASNDGKYKTTAKVDKEHSRHFDKKFAKDYFTNLGYEIAIGMDSCNYSNGVSYFMNISWGDSK